MRGVPSARPQGCRWVCDRRLLELLSASARSAISQTTGLQVSVWQKIIGTFVCKCEECRLPDHGAAGECVTEDYWNFCLQVRGVPSARPPGCRWVCDRRLLELLSASARSAVCQTTRLQVSVRQKIIGTFVCKCEECRLPDHEVVGECVTEDYWNFCLQVRGVPSARPPGCRWVCDRRLLEVLSASARKCRLPDHKAVGECVTEAYWNFCLQVRGVPSARPRGCRWVCDRRLLELLSTSAKSAICQTTRL